MESYDACLITENILVAEKPATQFLSCVSYSYNCKEEFQIHDDLLKASYTVGRITEATPEHYLVQVNVADYAWIFRRMW